jgi:hypothetical protein
MMNDEMLKLEIKEALTFAFDPLQEELESLRKQKKYLVKERDTLKEALKIKEVHERQYARVVLWYRGLRNLLMSTDEGTEIYKKYYFSKDGLCPEILQLEDDYFNSIIDQAQASGKSLTKEAAATSTLKYCSCGQSIFTNNNLCEACRRELGKCYKKDCAKERQDTTIASFGAGGVYTITIFCEEHAKEYEDMMRAYYTGNPEHEDYLKEVYLII